MEEKYLKLVEEKLKERNKEEKKVNGVKENGTDNKENQPEKSVSALEIIIFFILIFSGQTNLIIKKENLLTYMYI